MSRRRFETLAPREVLALAIHVERSCARRFRAFADSFRGYDEEVARLLEEQAGKEDEHERRLTEKFRGRFGGEVPAIEEGDVDVVIESHELDDAEHRIFADFTPLAALELTVRAERRAAEFYRRALAACEDPELASLFRELEAMEAAHTDWVEEKIRRYEGSGA